MAKSNETWVTINGNHVCIDSKSGKITKGPDALKGMTVMQASKASKSSKSTSSKKSTTAKTGAKKAQPVKKEDTSKKKDTPKKKEKMVYVNGEWAVVDENGTIVRAYQHGLEGLNYNDRKGIAKATKEANAPIIEDLKKDAIKLAKSTKGMTEDERERVLMREAEGLAHEDYFDAFTKAFDTEVKKQNKANTSFTKSESKKKEPKIVPKVLKQVNGRMVEVSASSTTPAKASSTTKASTKTTEKKNSSTNSHISKTGLEVVHYDGFGGGSHNVYYINGKRVSAKEAKSKYPSQFNSRGWYEGTKGGTKSTSSSTSTKKQRNYTKSTAEVMKSFNTKSTKELQNIVTKSNKVLKDRDRYPDSQIDYSWQKAYTEQKAAKKLLDSKTSTAKKKTSSVPENFTGWKGNKRYYKGQWIGVR